MAWVIAHAAEDADGEGDFVGGVALVGVNAALHDGDGDVRDGAEDEAAGVARDGGLREVRDVGEGDGGRVFKLGGEGAEAGAEDDADARAERGADEEVVGGGGGFVVLGGHVSCRESVIRSQ